MLEMACARQGMQHAASQMHGMHVTYTDACQQAACTVLDASQNAFTIADACQYPACALSYTCQHVAFTTTVQMHASK